MATITKYDQSKKEVGTIELPAEVFEVGVRPEILHLVVRAHLAELRSGTHATLNRALMKGGGRKPWRQKGTGRARAGSVKSPLWRGGATIFGPQPRSYEFKVNKKVRKLALRMAYSSRLITENLIVLNALELKEIKTKGFTQIVESLGLRKALVVLGSENSNVILSARNVRGITVMQAEQVTVYDILRHRQLVLVEDAVKAVHERLK